MVSIYYTLTVPGTYQLQALEIDFRSLILSKMSAAIVIDNGSATCKAGLATGDAPSVVLPTVVSHPRGDGNFAAGSMISLFKRDMITDLKYPIERGVVNNWDDMEKVP